MPEIYIHAMPGRSDDQKRGLVRDITDAMVKNYGVAADQVVISIIETPASSKAKGGKLFSDK